MIPFLVLRASSVLKIAVDVGLVVGIQPPLREIAEKFYRIPRIEGFENSRILPYHKRPSHTQKQEP